MTSPLHIGYELILFSQHQFHQITKDELQLLDESEKNKWQLAKDKKHLRLSVLWRLILKKELQTRLNLDPKDLLLNYGPNGKPEFANAHLHDQLFFNASHTKQTGILCLSDVEPVGIDIESLDRSIDWKPLATRYFPKKLFNQINQSPPENQKSIFLKYWTALEACLKLNERSIADLFSENPREYLYLELPKAFELSHLHNMTGHLACHSFASKTNPKISIHNYQF